MEMSAEIAALAEAMAKAQAEIKGAVKDASNPFYKSNYASLESVREACVGPLSKHGIAVFQSPNTDGSRVSIDTLLAHTSGQWIKGTVSAHAKDDSPQSIGSAISYLRRYALQSFAGVAPEDDDGEAATERSERVTSQPPPARSAAPKPTAKHDDSHAGPRVTHAKIAGQGANSKGPWTLYAITFSNGQEGTTFSQSIYRAALGFKDTGQEVEPVIEDRNGKKTLVELRPIFRRDSPVAAEVGTEA